MIPIQLLHDLTQTFVTVVLLIPHVLLDVSVRPLASIKKLRKCFATSDFDVPYDTAPYPLDQVLK